MPNTANAAIKLFNFYRRYKWTETDFTEWQTGMVEHSRGMFDGLFHGAVLQGLAPTSGAGLSIDVSDGIACGPSGFLNVAASGVNVSFAAPTGANPRRDLIVIRPALENNTYITRPTNPFDSVPLKVLQKSTVVAITGTAAATPEYPATQANDVVLCGVRVQPSQTSFVESDFDLEVRDSQGKNSLFQQHQAKFDNRCRPYKSTNQVLGLKPSQLLPPEPRSFLYVNKTTPSKFPLDGSSNFTTADTLLNFQTGTVTGGDAQTADFTPTIPTSGNWIVATISLKSDHTLSIAYGTQGTRAQCWNAIINQVTVGAGAIASPSQVMRLAFVLLKSGDGATIHELDFVDARTTFYFGGPDNIKDFVNVFVSAAGNGDATTLEAGLALMPVAGGVLLIMDDVTLNSTVVLPTTTKILGRSRAATLTFGSSGRINVSGNNSSVEELRISTTDNILMFNVTGDKFQMQRCSVILPPAGAATGVFMGGNRGHISESHFTGVVAPSTSTAIEYGSGTVDNSDAFNIFGT